MWLRFCNLFYKQILQNRSQTSIFSLAPIFANFSLIKICKNWRARQPEAMLLRLPQLSSLHEVHSRDNGIIGPGQQVSQAAARIPSQRELTRQISAHWAPFIHTRRNPPNARLAEEKSLRATQTYTAAVQESTIREEMRALEPAHDDAKPRTLKFKPLGWLPQIRATDDDESWPIDLW